MNRLLSSISLVDELNAGTNDEDYKLVSVK